MKSQQKQAGHVISLDIGSTFTKAAIFHVECDQLVFQRTSRVPTTTDSLLHGVRAVIDQLDCLEMHTAKPIYPVYYSSSAKGGLNVVAVGIVPELTLKVAKLAALSAGAKVTRSYDYKLTSQDIREIESLNPDIILLSGGTDGGNESYVLHNGQLLSGLSIKPQVVYAGNKALRDEISSMLSNFSLHLTDNILPELDQPCVDQAREKICQVFLNTIVSAKGLDEVIEWLGQIPIPTPLAVLELVEAIGTHRSDWSDFAVIDMGGATTDFYSSCTDDHLDSNVIYRGLPEPNTKRTVEGDLGIRSNAASVLIAGSQALQNKNSTDEILLLMDYVDRITQQTGYLPEIPRYRGYDRILADICMTQAVQRHAGVRKRVFTEQGESYVQSGKNLRMVEKMILTGGFFSSLTQQEVKDYPIIQFQKDDLSSSEKISLVPQNLNYYQDKHYLIPLLGNLVRDWPRQASNSAIHNLVLLPENNHQPMESTC